MRYNKYSVIAMLGHVCSDINQGALPAILPFLVTQKGFSYAAAAGLVFASNSVSSIIQPLFGYLGDRFNCPWLMSLGVFLAGSGLAAIGFLESYAAIFAAVSISGIGLALFHPEGGRMANIAATKNKGSGMALFAVGGNLGFAIGPIVASVSLAAFGLKGTAILILPAAIMALVLLFSINGLRELAIKSVKTQSAESAPISGDDWGSFTKVASCLTARAIVNYGLITFIPLYFVTIFAMSDASASSTLSLFSLSAAAATFFGGIAADRFGFRTVIIGCLVCLPIFVFIFPFLHQLYLAVAMLIPLAIAVSAPQGAIIALGQSFLPRHVGTASGIMLGLAVSVGGMVAPGIGVVADHYGLPAAMFVTGSFGLVAMVLAFMIPERHTIRK